MALDDEEGGGSSSGGDVLSGREDTTEGRETESRSNDDKCLYRVIDRSSAEMIVFFCLNWSAWLVIIFCCGHEAGILEQRSRRQHHLKWL